MTTTATTPNFIPGQGAMDDIPRDLNFYPSVNTHPKTLTVQQIEQFNRDGYLKPFRIFDDQEILAIRAYFDELLSKTLAAGGSSYSIATAHRKHGRVHDILVNPRIVALVADLLGDDVVGWGSHFFCKMPGDGKRVSWHQDASYWPLTPARAVTVWLAIDDADMGNGCMRYIPGTHHFGPITAHLSEEDEGNVLNQSVANAESFGEPIPVELKAGEASIHSDMLLHGSEANTSTRRRCGLTLRYTPTSVRAYLGWNEKGVVVSGVDVDKHWSNPPRPMEE